VPCSIVVVGSVNQDLHLSLDQLPRPGETVLAAELRDVPGGKGANQAVAVARHHGCCVLVGAVGADETGAALAAALGDAGVDTTHLRSIEGVATGTAVVMVDSHGQNSIVVASGANLALTPDDVVASLERLSPIDCILTQGELSAACIAAAARFAAAHGSRFVLNLAPFVHVTAETLAVCDPLIVNEVEAVATATSLGIGVTDAASLTGRLAPHCRSVITTLGADGATWSTVDAVGTVAAPEVDVVDSTGAGDAFVGAAVAALVGGADLAASCQAGVAAGTLAVQYRGAQSEALHDITRSRL